MAKNKRIFAQSHAEFRKQFDVKDFVARVAMARKVRRARGKPDEEISQRELCSLAGLSPAVVQKIEGTDRPNVSLAVATKICRALRIRLDWACYNEGPMDDLGDYSDDEDDESGVRNTPINVVR